MSELPHDERMTRRHWPSLSYADWQPTGANSHMWAQIVGKFRLALAPWLNHAWHATLYADARGFTTGLVPGHRGDHQVRFDVIDHRLVVESDNGDTHGFPLEAMSVAEFWERFTAIIRTLEPDVRLHTRPNELPDAVPFAEQTADGTYDPEIARDFWQATLRIDRVFRRFRTGFLGKSSPSHLFWGSFDLAVTRFSGRPAPRHTGGIPNLPDAVTREAYSHEVSSAGFWPGGGGVEEAAFYAYAYPTPEGYKDAVEVGGAYWHDDLGEYVLPYAVVQASPDPEATLMDFLQRTYAAAADLAHWDRAALDCPIGTPGVPREV